MGRMVPPLAGKAFSVPKLRPSACSEKQQGSGEHPTLGSRDVVFTQSWDLVFVNQIILLEARTLLRRSVDTIMRVMGRWSVDIFCLQGAIMFTFASRGDKDGRKHGDVAISVFIRWLCMWQKPGSCVGLRLFVSRRKLTRIMMCMPALHQLTSNPQWRSLD